MTEGKEQHATRNTQYAILSMSFWRDHTMSNSDLAVACFEEGFNCSQSVLSPFAPTLGLDRETALRVAAPFGGGMGRTGETCGAASGALIAIGLRYAQPSADDKDAKEKT
jgi:hypothetical protein